MRNLKSLGLALVAMLAMNAVIASAAVAAPEFTASPAGKATGTNSKGSETFTTPGGTVTCDSHFLVEAVGGGNLSASSQATVVPNYSNCEAFGFLSADVTENGCDYVFTATEPIGFRHTLDHIVVACPAGKAIVITTSTCEVQIVAQTSLTDVTTKTNLWGSVSTIWTVSNMTLNVTKDGFGCPFSGTGHQKGAYHGEVTLSGLGGSSFSVSGS